MIVKIKNRKRLNIIFITLIVIVLLSNIFTRYFNTFLRLKPNIPKSTYTQVHFIDVGQGDAMAIKLSNGKIMLVDSGTAEYRSKLTRYLDKVVLKDKKIDYLVLTHSDKDHMSNMKYIVENYEIGTFYRPPIYLPDENLNPVDASNDYAELITCLKQNNIPIIFNDMSNNISDVNITIKWLYPDINDLYGYDETSLNNLSCVLLLEDNGKRMLLTGDIDSNIESSLVNMYGNSVLDVDILKLAHHGSNYSTSELFLNATSPKLAIASVGENSYNHPGNDTIARILNYDKLHNTNLFNNFYTTLSSGNIIVNFEDLNVTCIDNIDNYSFVPYFVYTLIAMVILMYFLCMPYLIAWLKFKKHYKYNQQYRIEKHGNK